MESLRNLRKPHVYGVMDGKKKFYFFLIINYLFDLICRKHKGYPQKAYISATMYVLFFFKSWLMRL